MGDAAAWSFSLLDWSLIHSDSLLSVPTALVWLLGCFGLLPALRHRLRFSQSSFYTSLFILLKDPSLHRKESAWLNLVLWPWEIHLLALPPCSCIWVHSFSWTHLPIPNQGYLKYIYDEARGLIIRHWTRCFASVSLFTDPQVPESLFFGNTELFVTSAHALHMIFFLFRPFPLVEHLSYYFHWQATLSSGVISADHSDSRNSWGLLCVV